MGSGDETVSSELIVRCPKCGKIYKVHTDRVPRGVFTFPCRGCGSLLPIGSDPGSAEEAEEKDGAPTILVAVGEEDLAALIRKILKGKGYRVLVGSTGGRTLEIIEKEHVDLLVVSVFFPDIMGFEILDRVKGGEGEKPVRSILLSSVHHGTRYKRAPTSLYGADDYIERHHLPDFLLPKIERLLKGGSAAEPAPETPPSTAPLTDEQILQKRELEEIERSPGPDVEDREQELRRLCRVIAGDIVLYNESRIRNAEPSRLLEAIKDDLEEGEALLEGKFGEEGRKAARMLREEIKLMVQARGSRQS